MSFERNFYKASAVCPKCGSDASKPKYVPPDYIRVDSAINCHFISVDCSRYFGKPAPKEPDYKSLVILDKVINACKCGYEWDAQKETQE